MFKIINKKGETVAFAQSLEEAHSVIDYETKTYRDEAPFTCKPVVKVGAAA